MGRRELTGQFNDHHDNLHMKRINSPYSPRASQSTDTTSSTASPQSHTYASHYASSQPTLTYLPFSSHCLSSTPIWKEACISGFTEDQHDSYLIKPIVSGLRDNRLVYTALQYTMITNARTCRRWYRDHLSTQAIIGDTNGQAHELCRTSK